jgi:hypothetical protein
MRHQTVVSLQVATTAGKIMFIASKGYEGLLFPKIGSTVTIKDHPFTIFTVDWDIEVTVVRVGLEPIALEEQDFAKFRRDWEVWGGKIYDGAA